MDTELSLAVSRVGLGFAIVSFAIYVSFALGWVKSQAHQNPGDVREAMSTVRAKAAVATPQEVADLINALSALADSLAKAGPALWSMIGSIAFLVVAWAAAGAAAP